MLIWITNFILSSQYKAPLKHFLFHFLDCKRDSYILFQPHLKFLEFPRFVVLKKAVATPVNLNGKAFSRELFGEILFGVTLTGLGMT